MSDRIGIEAIAIALYESHVRQNSAIHYLMENRVLEWTRTITWDNLRLKDREKWRMKALALTKEPLWEKQEATPPL